MLSTDLANSGYYRRSYIWARSLDRSFASQDREPFHAAQAASPGRLCLGPNCVRAAATLASETSTASYSVHRADGIFRATTVAASIQFPAVVLVCLGQRRIDLRLIDHQKLILLLLIVSDSRGKYCNAYETWKGSLSCGEPLNEKPLHATSILWIGRRPMTQVLWNVARSLDLLLGRWCVARNQATIGV